MLNKQLGLAIGTAVLFAAVSIAPVSATDMPLTKSKPAAAAGAPAVGAVPAVERRVVRRAVVRRAAPAPFVRVAAVERRTPDCSLFFCWRAYPLILGVGF